MFTSTEEGSREDFKEIEKINLNSQRHKIRERVQRKFNLKSSDDIDIIFGETMDLPSFVYK